jgi:hypothetical protein
LRHFVGQTCIRDIPTIPGRFRKSELAAWTAKFIDPDSIAVSDGLSGRSSPAAVAAGVETPELKWVNTLIGDVKNALHGI